MSELNVLELRENMEKLNKLKAEAMKEVAVDEGLKSITVDYAGQELELYDDFEAQREEERDRMMNGKWESEESFPCRGLKKYGCTRTNEYDHNFVCQSCYDKEKNLIDSNIDEVHGSMPVIEGDEVRFV